MTMETFAFRELAEPIVFSADMPIFEHNTVDAWNGRGISRFGHDVWDLTPLMDEATDQPMSLKFAAAPENFRESLKRLMYCLINRPLPRDMLRRNTQAIDDLAAGTYANHLSSAMALARVLDDRDRKHLCDASDADFRVHKKGLEDRSSEPRSVRNRLFNITRCSLYGEYLPVEDRIPLPPWAKRSGRRKSVTSRGTVLVNKTPAIAKGHHGDAVDVGPEVGRGLQRRHPGRSRCARSDVGQHPRPRLARRQGEGDRGTGAVPASESAAAGSAPKRSRPSRADISLRDARGSTIGSEGGHGEGRVGSHAGPHRRAN